MQINLENTMQINNDFSRVVVVSTSEIAWQPSPSSGVMLHILEQGGLADARTTSIVRFESGTNLPSGTHEFGEEIIVLEGMFSDDSGVYSAGTYIKNPSVTNHTLLSECGCILFIKQGHLQHDDLERVVVDVQNSEWRQGMVGGLSVLPLSEFKGEHSALVRWQPGTVFNPHRHWGGEEIYVLEGVFEDEFGRYPAGTWLRNPHMSQHAPFSREGCTIFVKVGHLPEATAS
jgi:anti-sigma factor ChrR (cupin superfamily)